MMSMLMAFRSLNALKPLVTTGSSLNSGWRIDPEVHLPFQELEKICLAVKRCNLLSDLGTETRMLSRGNPYDGEVRLRDVRGVIASKSDYCANLDAMPESMNLLSHETYGPFDEAGMARLRAAVEREFGGYSSTGRYQLYRQTWDGMLIGSNSGASRRFALWRRLERYSNPGLRIRATITDISISDRMLELLQTHRIAIFQASALPMIDFWELRDRWPNMGFASMQGGESVLILPKPETMLLFASWLARIHNRLEQDGCFDLGRYLTERRDMWKPVIAET